MEPDTLAVSLKGLTLLLEKHYHQKVVVLIDEYDVPLAKAYENGYYDEMILLIRNLFGNVLKTNDSLAFAGTDRMPENCKGKHLYRVEQF